MTVTPIIIPTRSESPKCPSCKQNENKKVTCRSCGYEYADGDMTWKDAVIMTFIVFLFLYTIFLGCEWIIEYENKSLFEVIKLHFEYISNLKIW